MPKYTFVEHVALSNTYEVEADNLISAKKLFETGKAHYITEQTVGEPDLYLESKSGELVWYWVANEDI